MKQSKLVRILHAILLEMGSHTDSPFPPNLRELILYGFKGFKTLPSLPISLEKLVLMNCKSIIEFPMLPPHLRELRISAYDQIKYIGSDERSLEGIGIQGKLPVLLRKIHLSHLKNLVWMGLPPNLEFLSIYYCDLGKVTVLLLPRRLIDFTSW
jgi:hypothetical protein